MCRSLLDLLVLPVVTSVASSGADGVRASCGLRIILSCRRKGVMVVAMPRVSVQAVLFESLSHMVMVNSPSGMELVADTCDRPILCCDWGHLHVQSIQLSGYKESGLCEFVIAGSVIYLSHYEIKGRSRATRSKKPGR